MLKYLLIIAFIAAAYGDDDAHAHVAKDFRKGDGHGHFSYGYDITNGIGAGEAGDEHEVHGEYHFTTKEGVPVKVSYTADENGYHPHGDSLPTPPSTPEAILKALKYIKEHPHKEENHHHDGHQTGHNSGHQSGHHDTHHSGHHSSSHQDSHHH